MLDNLTCPSISFFFTNFNIKQYFLSDGFVRRCEMYSEIANAAKECKGSISMGDCNDDHQFSCVSGIRIENVVGWLVGLWCLIFNVRFKI